MSAPRTDAEVFELQDCNGQLRKVITTQFAKQLERELLAARDDAFNLSNALSHETNIYDPKAWNDATEAFIKDLKHQEQELSHQSSNLLTKIDTIRRMREDMELHQKLREEIK